MVFHSLRRLIQDWIAINDEAPADLNEFWINKHEIMLQDERSDASPLTVASPSHGTYPNPSQLIPNTENIC